MMGMGDGDGDGGDEDGLQAQTKLKTHPVHLSAQQRENKINKKIQLLFIVACSVSVTVYTMS